MVNYYSEKLIFQHLEELSHPEFEFLVVDNSSTFPPQGDDSNLRLFVPGENLGFAKAVNLASKSANGKYLIFLNPDVEIERSVVIELLDRVKNCKENGVFAPKISEAKQANNLINGGKFPGLISATLHLFGISRISKWSTFFNGYLAYDSNIYGNPRSLDWISGAVMIIKRDFFIEIGAFREDWFMYSEDIELCLRIRDLGFSVLIFSDLYARHLGGESDSRPKSDHIVDSLWYKNLTDLYIRYFVRKFKYLAYVTWCVIWSIGFFNSIIYSTLKIILGGKNDEYFREKRKRSWAYQKTSMKMITKCPKYSLE
jgi:GT2 family glycosyltransferase